MDGVYLKRSWGGEVQNVSVLVAVGLAGNVEEVGLETVGLSATKGFLAVDGTLQTSVPGVYAIGDLIGPPLLAHVASAEASTRSTMPPGSRRGRSTTTGCRV